MPIVEKLREALKPGRREQGEDAELGRLLAASAKKVLLQKIEFEPASRGPGQPEGLRGKYLLLNPRPPPAPPRTAPGGPPGRQGRCGAPGGGGMGAARCPPPAAHPPPGARRRRAWAGGRGPRAAEGAVPRGAPVPEVGAGVAGGRRAAQPGQHVLPQRHPAVPHLHAAPRQLPAVQGARPCL